MSYPKIRHEIGKKTYFRDVGELEGGNRVRRDYAALHTSMEFVGIKSLTKFLAIRFYLCPTALFPQGLDMAEDSGAVM